MKESMFTGRTVPNNAPFLKAPLLKSSEIEEKYDKKLSFAVCFQVSVIGIKNALVQGIPLLYQYNSFLNYLLLAIVAIIYIVVFCESWDRIVQVNQSVLLMAVFILSSFLVTWILCPVNRTAIRNMLPRVIPYYFLTAYMITKIRSTKWIEYYMVRFSYLGIIACVITSLFIYIIGHVTTSQWLSYSMPMSYTGMLATIWVLHSFYQNKKFYKLLFVIAGIGTIILYGSRNPLIGIAVYIAVIQIRNTFRKDASIYKKAFLILFMLVGMLLLLYYKEILTVLDEILKSAGIESRTLKLLLQNEIDMTGRTEIHGIILQLLSRHPLYGLGIGGDIAWTSFASHSLYLSILSIYGLIFGAILNAVLIYCCFSSYRNAGIKERGILLIYFCLTLPRGFSGGDVLSSDVFWWMIGICAVANRKLPFVARERG